MPDVDPLQQAIRKFDGEALPATTPLDVLLRCATDPPLAISTLLDAIRPAAVTGGRICELGFGPGWLIEEVLGAFPQARPHGLDLAGSTVAQGQSLYGDRVRFVRGDMERLPFADASFQAVATCWTLYFMRDIEAALREMKRCVSPGGRFVTATVAADHMREFDELVARAVREALGREREPDIAFRFDLESGAPLMARVFGDDVELREWRGELMLLDVETALVLWPGYGPQLEGAEDAASRAVFAELVGAEIAREGAWRVTRHDGAFVVEVR